MTGGSASFPRFSMRDLVILGTGFASFSLLKSIDTRRWRTTVISPRNHFLFTPLLPSTTVGTLEFRSIIESVRTARKGAAFIEARAVALDEQASSLLCEAEGGTFGIGYDVLVIGVGGEPNTFGVPGVREYARPLKELVDARRIRQDILRLLEQASRPGLAAEERDRLVHFVVVGGGPTGVEFAAELNDFLSGDLRRVYPDLIPHVRITLLEGQERILGSFDEVLGAYTSSLFARKNIEVRTVSSVASIDATIITLKDGVTIPYGLVVWSAGIAPVGFTRSLDVRKDGAGRVLTDEFLRVSGRELMYALGDGAAIEGMVYPMTAQVAQQQGTYLARQLNAMIQGKRTRAFRYRHYGMLAYVGSNRALADLKSFKGRGFITFLFWRSAYLTRLVSIRNKILVVFDWIKAFVFGRDISRF